eukprot:TRINITY_DN1781_c0_g1_i1.p1 TRINITY_DN1781_c0_g1~~TRINITY_DN1781_c0_g1_i1.p1  ORF type:complete len:840 (-),score=221.43 TRINITY_DN1781_c0_g1_i1:1266-3746(-)
MSLSKPLIVSAAVAALAFAAYLYQRQRTRTNAPRAAQRQQNASQPLTVDTVLEFWFGDASSVVHDAYIHRTAFWYRGSPEVDAAVTARFSRDVATAAAGLVSGGEWDTPRGAVALCLLLNQFPRNIFRGTPRMFETDPSAVSVARRLINDGQDTTLPPPLRLFLYFPLLHSEQVDDVRLGQTKIKELVASAPAAQVKQIEKMVRVAEVHLEILAKFGRYPYRNTTLKRRPTVAEIEYLRGNRGGFARTMQEHLDYETGPMMAAAKTAPKPQRAARAESSATIESDTVTLPMKILVLHGFTQSAVFLRSRTAKLRAALAGTGIQLIYANGAVTADTSAKAVRECAAVTSSSQSMPPPQFLETDDGESDYVGERRAWWNVREPTPGQVVYDGLDQSLAALKQLWHAQGPFDGVIGLSQGATLAAILTQLPDWSSLKFAVCVSGFLPAVPPFNRISHVMLPSFHIIGQADRLLENSKSHALAAAFLDPIVREHDGGHFAPNLWPFQEIAAFFAKFRVSVPVRAALRFKTFDELYGAIMASPEESSLTVRLMQMIDVAAEDAKCVYPVGLSQLGKSTLSAETGAKLIKSKTGSADDISWLVKNLGATPAGADDLLTILFALHGHLYAAKKEQSDTQHPKAKDLPEKMTEREALMCASVCAKIWGEFFKQYPELAAEKLVVHAELGLWDDYTAIVRENLENAPLVARVAEIFSEQLLQDRENIQRGRDLHAADYGPAQEQVESVSVCAWFAPRIRQSLDKNTHIARDIALLVFPISEEDPTDHEKKKSDVIHQVHTAAVTNFRVFIFAYSCIHTLATSKIPTSAPNFWESF